MTRFRATTLTLMLSAATLPAAAQDRANDNAVTQAEDGFGFSVGRETIGIYSSGNARGFSPTAAGNVRVEGLYFDPAVNLPATINASSSVKVGLSAQGYPFAAPSGIVDLLLRRPGTRTGASIVLNGDSFATYGVEVDASFPLDSRLSLGVGLTGGRLAYPDGTDNYNHGQALIARWRPAPGVEIVPFWTLNNDYNDEAGQYYVPAGKYLPSNPPRHRFDGPEWADYRRTGTNSGLVASYAPGKTWLLRLGAFRSVFDQKTGYRILIANLLPDGTGERLLEADPRLKNVSISGEARLTHSIVDGPRLHVLYLNLRERDARRAFGGSDSIDLGPAKVGTADTSTKPSFVFGALSRNRVRQTTFGIAYDLRWKGLGEVSVGVSRASYTKTTTLPGIAPIVSRSQPWLYNGTAAVALSDTINVYAGYARGLEESGVAPTGASNRNQPLNAVLTEQKDVGIRWNATGNIKVIAGVFDLRKPYFGFNAASNYAQVGTTRSEGAEISISGNVTPRLNIVAGGYFLHARVRRDPAALGNVGPRPVGLTGHLMNLSLNWKTPIVEGFSLDATLTHRAKAPSTTDNLVWLPARAQLNLGGRYRFKLENRNATLRLQVSNVFDNRSFNVAGSGVYAATPGRYIAGYLAIDV